MLLLALSIALAQLPDLSQKVTFTSVAKPTTRLLAGLSAAAGIPLTAGKAMDDDVLVVHFNDVPLSEAMKRIADVTHANWTPEGAGYTLTRSPSKVGEAERRTLAERTKAIQDGIRKMLEMGGKEPLTPDTAEALAREIIKESEKTDEEGSYGEGAIEVMEKLEAKTSLGRLMLHLLPLLDAKEIAQLPRGLKTVFSTTPTPMQRPIKGNVRPAMATFAQEHTYWVEAAQKVRRSMVNNGVVSSFALFGLRTAEAGVTKAILTVSPIGSALMIDLKVYGPNNRTLGRHSATVGGIVADFPDDLNAQASEQAIELSERSNLIAEAISTNKLSLEPATGEALQMLLNPEQHDPLSFAISDVLVGVAKGKGKSLVACVPDSMAATPGAEQEMPALTPTMVLGMLKAGENLDVVEEPGWFVMTPHEPLMARADRLNRAAFGRFLRTVRGLGRVRILEAAKLALAGGPPDDWGEPVESALGLVLPDEASTFTDNDINVLRFYGSLTEGQRIQLKQGHPFPFVNFSHQQRALMHRLLFGEFAYLNMDIPSEPDLGGEPLFLSMISEPTEALPNGMPQDGSFTLELEDQDVVYVYGELEENGRAMPIQELIEQLYNQEDPSQAPWAADERIDQFRPGKRQQLSLTFTLTKPFRLEHELYENQAGASRTRVAYKQLPQKLREEIEKGLAEHRKENEEPPRPVKKPPP